MVEQRGGNDFNPVRRHIVSVHKSSHPNGLLNPDTSPEELRNYLLDPSVYVKRPQGRSRNSGPRSR